MLVGFDQGGELGNGGGAAGADDAFELGQRLRHDLVHVVVLVRGQSAHEVRIGGVVGESLVGFVLLAGGGIQDGVVRVAVAFGIFVHQRCLGVFLTSQVLELGDARVGVVIRVIDNRG